jgi:hypothetical protein
VTATATSITCGACSLPVPPEFWNREEGVRCARCLQQIRVAVFPAIERMRTGAAPEPLTVETEASCFYHPQSRAAMPCDECGRFLCSLCELEVDGRHLCPVCFQSGASAQKIQTVDTRRVMYDTSALAMATLPALLFWPVVITAPWALITVFRRWRTPGSVVPRTRIRFYLAALFALAELAGVVFVIYMLSSVRFQR